MSIPKVIYWSKTYLAINMVFISLICLVKFLKQKCSKLLKLL